MSDSRNASARELMTPDPACCTPETRLAEVAQLMRDHDCGAIPVVEGPDSRRLVGIVTDRDLAVRGLAEHQGPGARVRTCMTNPVATSGPDDPVEAILATMERYRIRRIPIIDTDGNLLGLIAQADLARAREEDVGDAAVGEAVEAISEPTEEPHEPVR